MHPVRAHRALKRRSSSSGWRAAPHRPQGFVLASAQVPKSSSASTRRWAAAFEGSVRTYWSRSIWLKRQTEPTRRSDRPAPLRNCTLAHVICRAWAPTASGAQTCAAPRSSQRLAHDPCPSSEAARRSGRAVCAERMCSEVHSHFRSPKGFGRPGGTAQPFTVRL